jgi:hypothetical protein
MQLSVPYHVSYPYCSFVSYPH